MEWVHPNLCFLVLFVPLVLCSIGPSRHRKPLGRPSAVGDNLSGADTKPGGSVDDGFCSSRFLVLPRLFLTYLMAPSFSFLAKGLAAISCFHQQCEDSRNRCWRHVLVRYCPSWWPCLDHSVSPGLRETGTALLSRRDAGSTPGCSGTAGMGTVGV